MSAADVKTMIIAYEPVWAIGTGLVCPSETAQKVHKFLRGKLSEMYDQATADAVRIQWHVVLSYLVRGESARAHSYYSARRYRSCSFNISALQFLAVQSLLCQCIKVCLRCFTCT